jgi:translation initiation factor 2 subunit 1
MPLVKKKDPFPSVNDLVICTISKVFAHGAFARMDEYGGREGFIHISEVASTWIKNIRDFVKEGQKTVAKVLSVDSEKGHVDLSVRRVGDAQRKNKMQEWKRAQKAEKLLEIAAKEIKKSIDDAYEEVGFKLEDKYGEIYTALEEMTISGEEVFEGMNIPEEWKAPVMRVAKENIVLPTVNVVGYLDLRCPLPDGVERIKEAILEAKGGDYGDGIKLDIRYIKSPRFSVSVEAPDYRTAEEVLKNFAEKAVKGMRQRGGTGKFTREQK